MDYLRFQVQETDHGTAGERPPGVGTRLAPVDAVPVGIVVERRRFVGIGVKHLFLSSREAHQLGVVQVSFPHGIEVSLHTDRGGIIQREVPVGGDLRHFQEGGAGGGIGIPYFFEGVRNFPEAFFFLFAGNILEDLVKIVWRKEPGFAHFDIQAPAGVIRDAVQITCARHHNIAGLVIVRREMFVGALAPECCASPVFLVKSHLHKVEEIRCAGPGSVGQSRFRSHGVTLSAGAGKVDGPGQRSRSLADGIGKPLEKAGVFQFFQLRLMAGLMGRQLDGPAHGV